MRSGATRTDWEWKKYEKRLDKRVLELPSPSNEIEARAGALANRRERHGPVGNEGRGVSTTSRARCQAACRPFGVRRQSPRASGFAVMRRLAVGACTKRLTRSSRCVSSRKTGTARLKMTASRPPRSNSIPSSSYDENRARRVDRPPSRLDDPDRDSDRAHSPGQGGAFRQPGPGRCDHDHRRPRFAKRTRTDRQKRVLRNEPSATSEAAFLRNEPRLDRRTTRFCETNPARPAKTRFCETNPARPVKSRLMSLAESTIPGHATLPIEHLASTRDRQNRHRKWQTSREIGADGTRSRQVKAQRWRSASGPPEPD